MKNHFRSENEIEDLLRRVSFSNEDHKGALSRHFSGLGGSVRELSEAELGLAAGGATEDRPSKKRRPHSIEEDN